MRLNRVQIRNFRSIKDVVIEFDPKCRVLIGINESGKSNILRALALLGGDSKPVTEDDRREALPDESTVDEAFVRFVFSFEKTNSDELFETASKHILTIPKSPAIVSVDGKNLHLREICAVYNEGFYTVDIITKVKQYTCCRLSDKYQIIGGWKRPSNSCPKDFSVELEGNQFVVSEHKLIRSSDFPNIPNEYLEDAKFIDLNKLIRDEVIRLTEENIPEALVWEYDEKNLLPQTVNIAGFSADPNSCIPLKNMFALADCTDVNASITEARKGTDNQFQNFLDRIANKTTVQFRQIWEEYKDIEFSLKLNADKIIPGIKELNTHDFSRRSDGFKRFVTFLLMISVNVTTENLRNTLLIIDEPEVGLHPSSVRYLRDELVRVSSSNYVIYSTHSIFMIDSSNIDRHIIVKKIKRLQAPSPQRPQTSPRKSFSTMRWDFRYSKS